MLLRLNGRTACSRAVFIAILASAVAVQASRVFDKADDEGLAHLSKALVAFRESTLVSKLDTQEDWERFAALLGRVHSECAMISDATLQKVDGEFAVQVRSNLDGGCNTFAVAVREMLKSKKAGGKPSDDVTANMRDGHRRMMLFHEYYNSHIEAIIDGLRKKGIQIFG